MSSSVLLKDLVKIVSEYAVLNHKEKWQLQIIHNFFISNQGIDELETDEHWEYRVARLKHGISWKLIDIPREEREKFGRIIYSRKRLPFPPIFIDLIKECKKDMCNFIEESHKRKYLWMSSFDRFMLDKMIKIYNIFAVLSEEDREEIYDREMECGKYGDVEFTPDLIYNELIEKLENQIRDLLLS